MNSVNLKASVSFVGDGSTNKFYFGFDYINKQFVKVQVGAGSSPLTYLSDYTVDDRSVTLTDTPDIGVAIRVYRETPSDRIVEWADGAFIKASQMTLENLQQLHLIEEAQDYPILSSLSRYPDGINFNALGSRITGVSDPKDPQDVVTKAYMENVQGGFVADNTKILNDAKATLSATQQSQSKAQSNETLSKAWATSTESPDSTADTQSSTGKTQSSRSWALYSKEKAQEAATSEAHAKTSETNAKSSETKSLASEQNAKVSETNAKSSETKSLASEQNAKVSETNAKAYEMKSLASEQNAKVSETNAKTSEDTARSYASSAYSSSIMAKSWAESTGSPDGEDDSLSTTGKTKSAKGWAEQAKSYAGALNMTFILNTLLPIGTVYITENANFDPNTYWGVGTWEKTAINRVLQGTNEAAKVGTTIDAGLPNIIGEFKICGMGKGGIDSQSGAFSNGGVTYGNVSTQDLAGYPNGFEGSGNGYFNASLSNPIYGSSDTVQPPAELVFMWKRIA